MTDLDIQKHIEINCRNEHGQHIMDEQAFYEGAKWARDQLVNDKWISVRDRLPEAPTNVLVAHKHGVSESKYVGDTFGMTWNWNIEFPKVTHWMPLPNPPNQQP